MPQARIPDSVLDEIRSRTPLRELVGRHVALRRSGKLWEGCCPFHGEKTPSFYVYPGHVHCFGCGAHHDAIGYLARIERLTFPQAAARLAAECGVTIPGLEAGAPAAPWARPAPPPPAPARDTRDRDGEARRMGWAWRIWNEETRPIAADGPVARYLAGRRLWPLPAEALQVLREADLTRKDAGPGRHPCMVARVDGPDGTFRAIHRTYLEPRAGGRVGKLSGVKDAKLALGVLGGGAAIRLHPVQPLMGVAEGIETALAAWLLSGVPTWSCISAGGLAEVRLPFDVETLRIFADADTPKSGAAEGVGLLRARQLAARMRELAVNVSIRLPREPAKDFADVLMAREGVAA